MNISFKRRNDAGYFLRLKITKFKSTNKINRIGLPVPDEILTSDLSSTTTSSAGISSLGTTGTSGVVLFSVNVKNLTDEFIFISSTFYLLKLNMLLS